MIGLLDEDCSNKIRALQVITGIDSVIKELVENSLDANATIIDIRLTEYGLECIEIIDNGKGILKNDIDKIGGRNFTSKIKEFNELSEMKTYGYRGEALCCLTHVSTVTIITRHKSEQSGTKIVLSKNQGISKKIDIARETGTSVIISHLFDNIPVRKNEMVKNIRKQFSKVEYLIESYGIICLNTKITYSNTFSNLNNSSSSNKKKIYWSSKGGDSILTNISDIFTEKVASSLIKIVQYLHCKDSVDFENVNDIPKDGHLKTKINGFLSDIFGDNSGLSRKNKAFIFINNHPCFYPKLVQIVKNIYLSINPTLKSFILVLLIDIPTEWTDVNASTDKKTIYVKYDKWLEELVRLSINDTLNSSNNVKSVPIPNAHKSPVPNKSEQLTIPLEKDTNKNSSEIPTFVDPKVEEPHLSTFKRKESSEKSKYPDELVKSTNNTDLKDTLPKPNKLAKWYTDLSELPLSSSSPKTTRQLVTDTNKRSDNNLPSFASIRQEKELALSNRTCEELKFTCGYNDHVCDCIHVISNKPMIEEYGIEAIMNEDKAHLLTREDFKNMQVLGQFNLGFIIAKLDNNLYIVDQHAADEKYNFEQLYKDLVITTQKLVFPEVIHVDFMDRQILLENQKYLESCGFTFNITEECIQLISSPCVSEDSCFGKEDIYDFLAKKRMDFDNHETYASNMSGSILSQISTGRNTSYSIFNAEKLKSIFASKACRSSIMIGDSLSISTMKQEIDRLSLLDQPWNCPHGRPTIRHLAKLV